ncbi:DUF3301 domain-containing protein [Marinicella rhabdoformis]|uniref:DUF3301 domain-containing protein n=1 Tax=Marinicella rhabdoformis TaxID=2580566 RepID=UPI0012AED4B3|nr:DUF3301 domain-containing protein [Marinicella rhabdoformis]
MTEIPILFFFVALAYFWYNQMQALDHVRATGKHITKQKQWVFLDDSIVQKKLTIKPKAGKLCFYREFEFEFSDTSAKRYHGTITHHGQKTTEIQYFIADSIESIKLNH